MYCGKLGLGVEPLCDCCVCETLKLQGPFFLSTAAEDLSQWEKVLHG